MKRSTVGRSHRRKLETRRPASFIYGVGRFLFFDPFVALKPQLQRDSIDQPRFTTSGITFCLADFRRLLADVVYGRGHVWTGCAGTTLVRQSRVEG